MVLDYETEFEDDLPARMEILAEGFAKKWNAEQVNAKLLEGDCETLYARSYFEASLIYAFDHKIEYGQWKTLFAWCRELYDERGSRGGVFSGGKITWKQLEEYVLQGSDGLLKTENLTRQMEAELEKQENEQGFQKFMLENLEHFSAVREKARYYFCKYLYYYIREKCEIYYKSCERTEQLERQYGGSLPLDERGAQEKFALEGLTFLKPLTKLKKEAEKAKPGMTVREKREYLEHTSLTPGGIFDEFNYFYFGYISADWLEVLFELYGEFEKWPYRTRIKIARSLSLCRANAGKAEEDAALQKLEEMAKEQRKREEALDQEHTRGERGAKKLYQRGRVGEDYFRNFILGKKDINRSTLISFLLFVNARISPDADSQITIPRLNRILHNCGFAQLRPGHGFDQFVMNFLKARDPMEVVEREVEKQVVRGNDFYLYRVYKDAYCHQSELLNYLV